MQKRGQAAPVAEGAAVLGSRHSRLMEAWFESKQRKPSSVMSRIPSSGSAPALCAVSPGWG